MISNIINCILLVRTCTFLVWLKNICIMKENNFSDTTRPILKNNDNQASGIDSPQLYKKKNIKFIEDQHTALINQNLDNSTKENKTKKNIVYKRCRSLTCEDFQPKNKLLRHDIALPSKKTKFNKLIKREELNAVNFDQNTKSSSNEHSYNILERKVQKRDHMLLNKAIKEKNGIFKSNMNFKRHQMDRKNRSQETTSSSSQISNDESRDTLSSDTISQQSEKMQRDFDKMQTHIYETDRTSHNRDRLFKEESSSYSRGNSSESNIAYQEDIDEIHGKRKSPDKIATHVEQPSKIDKKQSAKTPFDYLVEEAQLEQKKMSKIESYEKNKMLRNREETLNKLKRQEELLNRELTQIEESQKYDDSVFTVKIEDDVKMYFCPEKNCKKKFPSLSRVKRHYIVHTGQKPYKCLNKFCKKAFSRKDNMLQHYRNHCFLSKGQKRDKFKP